MAQSGSGRFSMKTSFRALFILTALSLGSCSTGPTRAPEVPKKPSEKVSPAVAQELRNAKALADSGDSKRALPRLKKIVAQHPDSDVALDARFSMGNLHYANQQFAEALVDYEYVVKSPIQSPLEAEASIRAARCYLKLARPRDAEALLENLATHPGLTQDQLLQASQLQFEAYIADNRPLDALVILVSLAQNHPQPVEREKYRLKSLEVLERVAGDDLRTVADESKYGFLQASAKYRYALYMAENRDYGRARTLLAEAAQLAPGSELADRANALILQIDSRNKVDAKTVGVILPLSGKQAGTGYKALRGIQLGLGIYGKAKSNFRLAVIDSEGNPDVARRAVERLVTEDNVIAIIGGLLSKTASSEATKAQELGVPSIMLTQKSGVTQSGDFIFRNALTSQMQIQYLVDVAMNRLGLKSFAVIFPNDPYGIEYTNLFWDEVKARGGSIVAAQPYDSKENDFRGHVQRLVGTFYNEDRSEEYRLRLKAFQEKNPHRSSRQSAPSMEEILQPVIDFDAIFIPDSIRAVGQIAPMLAYNDINKVRLLGTNLWNNSALVTRGQKFVENAVFVDGFNGTDRNFLTSDFYSNFKGAFEEEPGLTEMQAYDSGLIIRQLIASGETNRMSLARKMATLQNFNGAIGPLSVNAEREFKRPVTALLVKDGKIGPLLETAPQ
jgi:branched-chain amino acid transport system substrate-binding protein